MVVEINGSREVARQRDLLFLCILCAGIFRQKLIFALWQCFKSFIYKMTLLKKYFLFGFFYVVLLSIANVNFAQSPKSYSFSLQTHSESSSANRNSHAVINLMTSGNENLAKSWNTKISLQYSFQYQNSSSLWLKINLLEITGNIEYRGFLLSKLLIPDKYSGWYWSANMGESPFEVASDALPASLQLEYSVSTPISSWDGVIKNAGFSQQRVELLQQYIQQINQYWALDNYVNIILLKTLNNENQSNEDINGLFQTRERIRKALILFSETATLEAMNETHSDPAKLWQKKTDLDRLLTRYNTLFQSAISESTDHSALIEAIASSYVKQAVQGLRSVYLTDFRDHELLLKANSLLPDESFYEACNLLTNQAQHITLAEKIAFEIVSLADSLYDQNDYSNALGFYEDARKVLADRGHEQAAGEVRSRVESAKLGLLRSYLQIASKALSAGNDSLSKVYQQKSTSFIQKYPQNGLINRIAGESEELVKLHIKKGNDYLDQKNYLLAIQAFEESQLIAKNYYNNNFNEQINQGLFVAYRQIYLQLVNEAENYFAIGETGEANKRLDFALNYQKDHIQFLRTSNEANFLLNKMIAQSNELQGADQKSGSNSTLVKASETNLAESETIILRTIKEAQLKVWANEIEEAWQLFEKATDLAMSTHLDKRKSVQDAFQELDKRMIARICLNHRFKTEDLMVASRQMIRNKNYEELEKTLTEIVEIQAANQGCGLQVDEAKQLLREYDDLFRYYHDYEDIIDILYRSGIIAVLPQYTYFDDQISRYHLEKYGLKHIDFEQFIRKQNNSGFTIQVLFYYIERMDAAKTETYLKILRKQDFDFMLTSELQQKAALLIAVADHSAGLTNTTERSVELTQQDRRFVQFEKTYLRTMKKLKRKK